MHDAVDCAERAKPTGAKHASASDRNGLNQIGLCGPFSVCWSEESIDFGVCLCGISFHRPKRASSSRWVRSRRRHQNRWAHAARRFDLGAHPMAEERIAWSRLLRVDLLYTRTLSVPFQLMFLSIVTVIMHRRSGFYLTSHMHQYFSHSGSQASKSTHGAHTQSVGLPPYAT